MIEVAWTRGALLDLETILTYVAAQSSQGAATIAARIRDAERTIATFPRATRRDAETGAYEAVVGGAPLLVIYELVGDAEGAVHAEIIAVFHTSRDPASKPGRRELVPVSATSANSKRAERSFATCEAGGRAGAMV